jgi:hypothetical protein
MRKAFQAVRMVKYYVGGNSRIEALNCQGKSMEPKKGSPRLPPALLALLGFGMEESGSSVSAGKYLSNSLPAYIPQREACEKINPKGGPAKTASLFEFP